MSHSLDFAALMLSCYVMLSAVFNILDIRSMALTQTQLDTRMVHLVVIYNLIAGENNPADIISKH